MAVLINFKICDNAEECDGIRVCPTGAIFWDEKKKSIGIDNSKCISCGKCEKACEVGAIRVAKTPEEYKRIKEEIDKDPRKISDLFIDRYGAQPIEPAFRIKYGFEQEVLKSVKLVAVELYSDDSIHCLLHSIPVKELFKDIDLKYRKVRATDELIKEFKIKTLPALLFLKNWKLIGKIEGYFSISQKEELKEKIGAIIKKQA